MIKNSIKLLLAIFVAPVVLSLFFIGYAKADALTASCQSTPLNSLQNPIAINQPVIFTSTVTGGIGTYTYSWFGACIGEQQNCQNSFTSAGNYSTYLTVSSGSESQTVSCIAYVRQPCASHDRKACVSNSVYWFDSCNNQQDLFQTCQTNQTCQNGQCLNVACSSNTDCGTNGYFGNLFCRSGNVYQDYITYTCSNPGTTASSCSHSTTAQLKTTCTGNQTCSSGACTANCTQNSYQRCVGNYLYWYDSCGNRQNQSQYCQYGCSNNYCQNQNCTPQSTQRCVGNSAYWYDSCGNQDGLIQTCNYNQICQNGACVQGNIYPTVFTVNKTVKNLSAGAGWSNSAQASPSDVIMFMITIRSQGNQDARNVLVRDILPYNLTYRNNLIVSGIGSNYSGDIISGINLGLIPVGQTVTITYQAQVAPIQNFNYGTSVLNNSVSVTASDNYSPATSSAAISVVKTAILGATDVSTGLTNNFLVDSFFLPLVVAILGIWLFKSGIFKFLEWADIKKGGLISYRAQRQLKSKILKIREKESN